MLRRFLISSAIVLLATLAFAQRQTNPRQTTELIVKVTYENDHIVVDQIRIQLMNATGVPIAETFTRGEGEARFTNLDAGAYRLRATGLDIDEKNSDTTFIINSRELNHFESLQVRKRPDGQATSNQGSISAAVLNIPPKAESEFDKGVSALKKQNFDEAQKRFNKAIEMYPRYAAAINNLGVIAMQQGRLDEGQTFFEQALKADDQYAPPYLNLAKSRMGHQKYEDAQQLLSKATSLEPSNVEVLGLLTVLDYQTNQMPAALANARKVHNLPAHERFAFAHFVAGRILETQNLPNDALAEYRLFLKESPEGPTAVKARSAIDTIEKQKR